MHIYTYIYIYINTCAFQEYAAKLARLACEIVKHKTKLYFGERNTFWQKQTLLPI